MRHLGLFGGRKKAGDWGKGRTPGHFLCIRKPRPKFQGDFGASLAFVLLRPKLRLHHRTQ